MGHKILAAAALLAAAPLFAAEPLLVHDAHIHYSHDAWDSVPVAEALAILDRAGVGRALVSSTPDEGTLKLYEAAPQRIVPELRPYRSREDMATWFNDPTIPPYLEERLARGIYRGIGEFHLAAGQTGTAVLRRVVQLAVERDLPLHAHSDAQAVRELFALEPRLRILWAHAGMSSPPAEIGSLLAAHPRLGVELSYRLEEVAPGNRLDPAWRELLLRYPDRFMVGTDTWTPPRWARVAETAAGARQWLAELPREVAEGIAYRNFEALFGR